MSVSNGCANVLKQNPPAQISANGWFVTMLSGAAYRRDLRVIVGMAMQWRERRQKKIGKTLFRRIVLRYDSPVMTLG